MRLQRIQELVYHRPWLITPGGWDSVHMLLEAKLDRIAHSGLLSETSADGKALGLSDFIVGRPGPSVENGVGFVHISGPIGIGLSSIEKICGATDVNDLLAELAQVQQDGAERIMLMVDSPGGMVGGTPETAAQIAAIEMPVFAYVGGGCMNCSAAYYLTAGADRIYANHSADVGSIGVYLPFVDRSAMYAANGVKIELIKNKEGDLKGAGYPGTALSDAQREDWQKGVQQIFDDFATHIREHRPGEINADTMRGQSFLAKEAYQRGLIDGVASLDSALRALKRYQPDG